MVETYPVPPDYVIEDIFAYLPAKAVYRFRCLFRRWAARLVSDDFADLHLRLANSPGVLKMLLLQDSMSRDGSGMAHVWSLDNSGGGGKTLMEFSVVRGFGNNTLATASHASSCSNVEVSSSSAKPSTHRLTMC
jgi:hypothetical protein